MDGRNTAVKEVTLRDLSSAYCSVAEIYLTDAWFVYNYIGSRHAS